MRFLHKLAASTVAVAALTPAAATAAPAHNGTFTPSAEPTYLTQGPDGAVWFSMKGPPQAKELGRIAPDGSITEFDTPNDRKIVGITAGPDTTGGPNTRIWASYDGGVIEWDPTTKTGVDHAIATLTGPRGLTTDKDGNLWAVASTRLVKINATDGTKIDDVLDTKVSGRDIASGSDGRIWVADFGNTDIVAVDRTAPYASKSFDTVVAPQGIAAGPAGQLGISLPNSKMGRITNAGAITTVIDDASDAFGTTFGADGAYWYAQFNKDSVGRLTPAGQYTRPISLPGSGARYITAGPNKTLWVSGEKSKKIYRITGVEAPKPKPATPPKTPPANPGTPGADRLAPTMSGARFSVAKRRLTVTLSESASLRLRVDQRVRGKWKTRRTASAQGVAGANRVALGRKFQRGSYRLVARATDGAGNASTKTIKFKVKTRKR